MTGNIFISPVYIVFDFTEVHTMCGIVGYIGKRNAVDVMLQGYSVTI